MVLKLSYLFPLVGILDHVLNILSHGSIKVQNIFYNQMQMNCKTFSKAQSNWLVPIKMSLKLKQSSSMLGMNLVRTVHLLFLHLAMEHTLFELWQKYSQQLAKWKLYRTFTLIPLLIIRFSHFLVRWKSYFFLINF